MKDRTIENLQDAIELIDEIDSERANREIHTFEHDGDHFKCIERTVWALHIP